MSKTRHRFFVSSAPGLEELLAQELSWAGTPTPEQGGVQLAGDRELLWRLCAESRLAEHVRVRVGKPFLARSFEELQRQVARQPWAVFFARNGAMPEVRAVCHGSRLYHSDAVAERVAKAVNERLGATKVSADALSAIHVRIVSDRVALSVDAGGELLHRRGYRQHVMAAPLRETLAAACLLAAGYGGEQALWDPFCGSGTIVLEALALSRHIRWGTGRSFAFERWPDHDKAAYRAYLEAREGPGDVPPFIGSDRLEAAVQASRHNQSLLDPSAKIGWHIADFEAVADEVPRGAAVVTNPPYGERTDRNDLERTYRRFGDLLRRRSDLGPVVLLVGGQRAARLLAATRLRWETLYSLKNSGLPARIVKLQRD